jgi:glycosyltransferase involved in cell wall biosynthesis
MTDSEGLRPKILILGNSASGGGAEKSMLNLMDELISRNFPVDYCSIHFEDLSRAKQGKILSLGLPKSTGFGDLFKAIRRMKGIFKRNTYSHLIVNTELAELVATFSIPINLKMIIVEHTSRPWNGRKILGTIIRILLNCRNPIWVTVNSSQSRIWPIGKKSIYIPNPVVPFESERSQIDSELAFVGRLNDAKHPELAARAALESNLTISFLGDGPLFPYLVEKFQTTKCRFLGYVDNPWGKISRNTTIIVASEFEGDGLTVVEAVINGNPILLADNQDLRRFNFPDKNYFSGEEELTNKLRELANSQENDFRIGDALTKFTQESRDIVKIGNQWEVLIRKSLR